FSRKLPGEQPGNSLMRPNRRGEIQGVGDRECRIIYFPAMPETTGIGMPGSYTKDAFQAPVDVSIYF
ncbi:MAG: hypothetical protein PHP59_07755, partial [Methanofollis sp.]|uniref:hypothetical protein n=1 Tax=Methanofollis sp. TaxID=2052835 RepID=UPI00262B513F